MRLKKYCSVLIIVCLLIYLLFTIVSKKIVLNKYLSWDTDTYDSISIFVNGEETRFLRDSSEFSILYSEIHSFLSCLNDEADHYQRGSSSEGIRITLNNDNEFLHFIIAYSKDYGKVSLQIYDEHDRYISKYYNVNMEAADSFFQKFNMWVKAFTTK